MGMEAEMRQSHLIADAERKIVRATIDALLAAGFTISVNNGGDENELENSADKNKIYRAMFAADHDHLIATRPDMRGWVYFVYGNDGYDVRSDYTVNLEEILKPVEAVEKSWEEKINALS